MFGAAGTTSSPKSARRAATSSGLAPTKVLKPSIPVATSQARSSGHSTVPASVDRALESRPFRREKQQWVPLAVTLLRSTKADLLPPPVLPDHRSQTAARRPRCPTPAPPRSFLAPRTRPGLTKQPSCCSAARAETAGTTGERGTAVVRVAESGRYRDSAAARLHASDRQAGTGRTVLRRKRCCVLRAPMRAHRSGSSAMGFSSAPSQNFPWPMARRARPAGCSTGLPSCLWRRRPRQR